MRVLPLVSVVLLLVAGPRGHAQTAAETPPPHAVPAGAPAQS